MNGGNTFPGIIWTTLVGAKPEKLKHEINKNWYGSSQVIVWVVLSYLLINDSSDLNFKTLLLATPHITFNKFNHKLCHTNKNRLSTESN